MSKKPALQPYLEPHHWSLTAIVRRFVYDERRSQRTGSKTLEEIATLADERFGRFPDVRDFAMRQIRKQASQNP